MEDNKNPQVENDQLEIMDLNHNKNKETKEDQELVRLRKQVKRWRIVFYCMLLVLPLCGALTYRTMIKEQLKQFTQNTSYVDQKFNSVLKVMSKDWYFAKDIEDVETRLVDQAFVGMTTNPEDLHTSYMSKQEMEEFVQHLNRSFVGIGIQYTATDDGLHIVERVFKNSPAEKAGVLPGDIIHEVDGQLVNNLSNTEIADLVRGEKGSVVKISFLRNGKTVALSIERDEIHNTTFGEVVDGIGYLQILQFGESTDEEVKMYLDDFKNQNVGKLMIDLRNDGGGYLDSLRGIANCLLPKDTAYIQREFANGEKDVSYTDGGTIDGIGPIVILVNENTASAAEALTIGLKEMRDDVTVIGTTTYGKGTVQITNYFNDGSALKFTTSKWMSPNGVWINGTGITPDEVVTLPDIFNAPYIKIEDGVVYEYDSVSNAVAVAQKALNYLEYGKLRQDGYFDEATKEALRTYQEDQDLDVTGTLTSLDYASLISSVLRDLNISRKRDSQYQRGLEVLHGE